MYGPRTLRAHTVLPSCTGVFIGLEALPDANLTITRKRSPRAEDYGRVRLLRDHRIQLNGSFYETVFQAARRLLPL